MKTIKELTRPNIWKLQPYSSARDEYSGKAASVFLDANESPYNRPNNRYPDPQQKELKDLIAPIKRTTPKQIFLGNGSDEAIDLLFRIFCQPAIDNVVAIDPTYGMYQVCADINEVEYRKVALDKDFQFDASSLLEAADNHTKLIFLCSPNNPTGNSLNRAEIIKLLREFDGLVILDEAYIDFSSNPSFLSDLNNFLNLIILQTFSKAWGNAAIRLGMTFAAPEIIELMNKIKYPYNVNRLTQQEAIHMIQRHYKVLEWIHSLLEERSRIIEQFKSLPCCKKVFPTDANFFLAQMTDATRIYHYLVDHGIIVRNRSHISLCQNCLRITIGTRPENDVLLNALRSFN